MKMDKKATATLLELAAKSLLSNEPAAIHALEEIPKDLFVPLLASAFLGGHATVLKEMVRVWPFPCLHIGKLPKNESDYEMLEAMIEGLQFIPAQNPSTCRSELMILDLMQEQEREITCPVIGKRFPFCSHSCAYSQCSIRKREVPLNVSCLKSGNSESDPQSCWKPTELIVDLYISGDLRKKQFISFLQNKFVENSGSLHLCCRGLHVDSIPDVRSILQFLDMACPDHLDVNHVYLSEVTTYFAEMTHLNSLSMSNVPYRYSKGRNFSNFLMWLGRQNNLQELILSSFFLKNRLHSLLRVLPAYLDTLCLSYCELSERDVMAISQSSQTPCIIHLNLSNNDVISEVYQSFQILLENISATLQHLEIDNCQITDLILSDLLPVLSHCYRLRIFSFTANPISMHMLRRSLQCLTSLRNLKHVIYPVPVDCYEEGNFYGELDMERVAEMQAQLKVMLQAVQRDDMYWTTSLD